MIPKINGLGRSFAGVAAYCLHDAPQPDDRRPETSERVGWTDTRNLATIRVERAARLMAATAKAAPDLKRLAGGARGGRKLAKPVLHYSLSWAQDETPDRQEMSRAVDGSLEALGLEGHEALIVAHDDTRHPHVHVIANRVDPETGKTATLGNSKLRLSRWAEGFEREQGRIRCEERVKNNARRRAGKEVVHNPWDRPLHWARFRREGMQPGRARRAKEPNEEAWVDMAAWRRAEAQAWERVEDGRWLGFWRLETRARKEWSELHKLRTTCGRGSTGRAAPYAADSGSGGPNARCGNWSGQSGAGRTWSRAGARISTGTTRASGPRWARRTPTAPGRSSGGCARATERGCGMRSSMHARRGPRRSANRHGSACAAEP